jgi:hypothetical protein
MKSLILLMTLVTIALAAPLAMATDNTGATTARLWRERQTQMQQQDAKLKALDEMAKFDIAAPAKTRQIGKHQYLCLDCSD